MEVTMINNESGRPISPATTTSKQDNKLSKDDSYYTSNSNISKYKPLILAVMLLVGYLHLYHYEALKWWLYGLMVLSLVIIIISLVVFACYARERVLITRAKRVDAEKKAYLDIITTSEGVWLSDLGLNPNIRALHLQTNYHSHSYNDNNEIWETWVKRNQRAPRQVMQELPQLPVTSNQSLDLLTELTDHNPKRVLIKAVSGAGKTTLLQHIVNRYLESGYVAVIDPHCKPKQWGDATVYGGGGDFDQITEALNGFIEMMLQRYKQLYSGAKVESDFIPFTIVIDEFMSIASQCSNAKDVMVRLITESRKANFHLFVGVHSDRVEALGLRGLGDIREGLTMVRLYNNNGVRSATIDYGQGELQAQVCSAFNGYSVSSGYVLELPQRAVYSEQDKQIYDLKQNGLSLSKVAIEVYGSKGGNQVNEVKQAIARVESALKNGVDNG